jgi:hypothetical protein
MKNFSEYESTKHVTQRMNQRGKRAKSIRILLEYGEEVENGFLMTKKAFQNASKILSEKNLKQDIQVLEKLKGWVLIVEDLTLITVYKASRRRVKRLKDGYIFTA